MYLDRISEAIAHFVGLFHIAAEQARLRDNYLEFKARQVQSDPAQPDEHLPIAFRSPYDFDNPDPGLHYVPAGPELETQSMLTHLAYVRMGIPIGAEVPPVVYPDYLALAPHLSLAAHHTAHSGASAFKLQPVGSVAVHVAQINTLFDNDFVNVGAGSIDFHPIGSPNLVLETLHHDALQLLPIQPLSLDNPADIGTFVADTAASLNRFAEAASKMAQEPAPDTSGNAPDDADGISVYAHVSVVTDPVGGGTYVNGQVAEKPELDDKLPVASPLVHESAETASTSDANGGNIGSTVTGGTVYGEGLLSAVPSVELSTGGNALVNSATVINAALTGGVFAVAGNHFSLDAIIQINAWSDSDAMGSSVNGWNAAAHQAVTSAYNIAEMVRIDAGTDVGADDHAAAGFPRSWVVTEISGDFISLNWIQQLNFVLDHDTAVVSASFGVTTQVGTGGNQAFNGLSITDIGRSYDLVLIGGNYYDANIISQTNVLLDDDIVGVVAGFHSFGHGSVMTGDNLLWNSASITSIGSAAAEGLPNSFLHAIQEFANGNKTLSSDVLNDSAFLGLPGLKVLYISGNIYDLQYIHQTNVLGDADEVALAMGTARQAMDANWSITTGSNVLVNSAQIVDVDPGSRIYVGGDHYTDELLVQTDVIRTDHLMETRNADHLVNEAVVFLSDDMAGQVQGDPVSHLRDPLDVHPGHSDIMQSVVS